MDLAKIPAMGRFLADSAVRVWEERFGTAAVKAAVDSVLRDVRAAATRDGATVPPFSSLVERVTARLTRAEHEDLVAVLNGTGILLHTNLGRAPLAPAALAAMANVGAGYSNLEYDLEAGARGSRYARLTTLLRATTGANDGLVVNNCAAAVLLVLDTFARGRHVIVGRGELMEIGGGFRLPDVLARSGASLVEVGTTNKTSVRDFERALTADTALLMRTHPSNYRIDGFTAQPPASGIARLGRRAGIATVEDLGSGALIDVARFGIPHERTVREAVADGFDLVAFSGDKLLGGPQAGVIVGTESAVARLRANPLLRALRTDKATLAALAATLRLYLLPDGVLEIPFYRMLAASPAELQQRAGAIAARLPPGELSVRPLPLRSYAGGGALPLETVPSYGLAVQRTQQSAAQIAAQLRAGRPRVVARIAEGSVLIDLRTIPADCDEALSAALSALRA